MNAIIKTETVKPVRVHVEPARDGAQIIDRIRYATASVADIRAFLRVLGARLNKTDLRVVAYALARARFREGDNLTIEQVAMLLGTNAEHVKRYAYRLRVGIREGEGGGIVTNNDAARIMCAYAD